MSSTESRTFKLMNIKTAEVLTLKYDSDVIDNIIKMILISKYTKLVKKTDDEFINNCITTVYPCLGK